MSFAKIFINFPIIIKECYVSRCVRLINTKILASYIFVLVIYPVFCIKAQC
jgi:hypothetical protein